MWTKSRALKAKKGADFDMLCMPLDEQKNEACSALVERLGLANARAHSTQTHRLGWRTVHRRPSLATWQLALDGHIALAPANLEWTSVIVLDLDDGHDATPRDLAQATPAALANAPTDDMDQWADAARRYGTRAARMRAYCAGAVRLTLERLRAVLPTISALATSSPRGAKIVIPLDEPADCAELHTIGQALVAKLGRDLGPIEVFPAPDGRMCRAPLTGRARLLAPDGETLLHRRRGEDRQALLKLPPSPLAELRALAKSAQPAETAQLTQRSDGTARSHGDDQATGTARFQLAGDDDARGKLRGETFIEAVCAAYDHGIGEGESWSVVRRWSFALVVGLGLSVDDAVATFRALVGRDNHSAKHCRTRSGRQRLLGTFRSCARRHGRAVERGEVTPRLRHPRLLAIIAELRGRAVEVPAARTRARVSFAAVGDADPVRARLAASRARRAEHAARAAKARHHVREALCPKVDDFYAAPVTPIRTAARSCDSPTSKEAAFSAHPKPATLPSTCAKASRSTKPSWHSATRVSTPPSLAPNAHAPSSPSRSTPPPNDCTPCSPHAPRPGSRIPTRSTEAA